MWVLRAPQADCANPALPARVLLSLEGQTSYVNFSQQPFLCFQLNIILIDQSHHSSHDSFTEKKTVKPSCGQRRIRREFWRDSPKGMLFALYISILTRANGVEKI